MIDEVIYWLDADGEIPLSVAVRPAPDGGVVVFLVLARSADAEITGAVPKAASRVTCGARRIRQAGGHARSRSTCSRHVLVSP